jgi:hypothetical protein
MFPTQIDKCSVYCNAILVNIYLSLINISMITDDDNDKIISLLYKKAILIFLVKLTYNF